MSVLTKGTHLFFINPDGNAVVKVAEISGFNPGGAPADPIERTTLDELSTKKYKRGLRTPGVATANLFADQNEESHTLLQEMAESENDVEDLQWAVGWSDGTSVPTVDTDGDFVLPSDRTWYTFAGYPSDFPFDFQLNALVSTTLSIQRSGRGVWTKKVGA